MRWMWIDRVIALEPGKRLVAIKNISLAEQHLHDHFAADAERGLAARPVMPASLILEGLAQSGGLLVGHAHGFQYNVVLAKVGKAVLERDAGPGCTLRYTAEIERTDAAGVSVRAIAEVMDHSRPGASFEPLGSAEMIFSHLDNSRGGAGAAGADFPTHNFVFGENFKTLMAGFTKP